MSVRTGQDAAVIPIVTPAHMRRVDASAVDELEVLVERAGRHVARAALEMLAGSYGRRVLVVAGKGNNGADGRVAANLLRRRGVAVDIVAVDSPNAVASTVAEIVGGTGRWQRRQFDLVVDAGFGTGARLEHAGTEPITLDVPVLAVDIASGLDGVTGVAGDGVVAADRTVTFQALKPGLVLGAGPAVSGSIDVADVGLDLAAGGVVDTVLVERTDVARWWPRRRRDAHKWSTAVRIVAGSPGMTGAAALCAAAASRAGAGMVVVSMRGMAAGTGIAGAPEVVTRDVAPGGWADEVLDDLDRFGSLVVGPGLGRSPATIEAVRSLVARAPVPVIIDGDGLAAFDDRRPIERPSRAATVLTPHDGEYRMLTGASPGPNRFEAARALAARTGCRVLLKGPTTIVAAPPDGDGVARAYAVTSGDERLATAGAGDVLAGMIGAAAAAGGRHAVEELAAAAAWAHGTASTFGPAGLVAGDLPALLPRVWELLA
jgi:NAD(P)H-hydrate epimerase